MAGTVHGLVNKRFARIAAAINGNEMPMFKAFAAFFDHLCTAGGGNYMTRVASRGDAGSDLQAVSYTANVFGVWKMNTSTLRPGGGSALGEIYILLAATGGSYFSALGLTAGANAPQNTVGLSIAFREDGTSPWNGGTDNDGADGIGDPSGIGQYVWTAGSSTVHVFPRSNNPGGSYDSDKDDTFLISGNTGNGLYNIDITYGFLHGIADEDNFAIVYSAYDALRNYDDPKQYAIFTFGLGDALSTNTPDPYLCYAWLDLSLPPSEDPSGYGNSYGGVKTLGGTVGDLYFRSVLPGLDASKQPNNYVSGGPKYDENAIAIATNDGVLGWGHEPSGEDFWRLVYGAPNEGYDATNKRAAFGAIATNTMRVTLPWPDSIGLVPGGSRTDAGVGF